MHCHSEICIATPKYALLPRKKRYSPEILPTHPQRTYKAQYYYNKRQFVFIISQQTTSCHLQTQFTQTTFEI